MGGRGAASGAANGMALGRKMSVSKFLENLKKKCRRISGGSR